ncbi:MFS transporter [Stenotrophomonas maltophilia]|nr:MFS transporter [Stenotrophomonas maltophilia]MBH1395336.1 MFS transporter [Stenotrophomonas maltophilia]MBH1468129.1 MFS transporter [Stenotrophomonas maltophilia]MBH1471845.1 MFS transporter [Stenotrophomonas maltophilia]MBH1835732.1 MFS transporter [Stenotrophomonas maltophilia]
MPQFSDSPIDRTLLSLMTCVFTVFLVTGAALPALPLHIHDGLGFSAFTVGLVSGAQFAAALLCRLWSGTVSDRRGPKFAVTAGLGLAVLAGLFYLASMMSDGSPMLSIGILALGRVLLGGAESFIMIGAQSRCLSLAGPGNVGKMIAWIGTAMFVALALGAPLGSFLYATLGVRIDRLGDAGRRGGHLAAGRRDSRDLARASKSQGHHAGPESRLGARTGDGFLQPGLRHHDGVRRAPVRAEGLATGLAVLHRLRRRPDGGAHVLRALAGSPRRRTDRDDLHRHP